MQWDSSGGFYHLQEESENLLSIMSDHNRQYYYILSTLIGSSTANISTVHFDWQQPLNTSCREAMVGEGHGFFSCLRAARWVTGKQDTELKGPLAWYSFRALAGGASN